ncbi:uncharacterized protein TNCV_2404581 [Trichonephila clavipes]|nr:uncharacterized protein TNCV_2404581 [Trichonephila clavipes]
MDAMRLSIRLWGILFHSSRSAISKSQTVAGGLGRAAMRRPSISQTCSIDSGLVATVAEWYRYRIVACLVTSSIPVPLKTRRVGQRCTLNLSRAETSSRWCGVVVREGGASSGVVHVT